MSSRPGTSLGAAVLLTAMALTGCGGGGDETTASSTSSGTTQATRSDGQGQKSAPRQKDAVVQGEPSSQDKDSSSKQSAPAARIPPISSAPAEGSKTPAPGVKTVKDGDNSVQSYGAESSDSARAEAAIALQAYLNARLAEDWQRACSYLAQRVRAELEQLAQKAQSQGRGIDGCASAMGALSEGVPQSALRESAEIEEVLSFRVEGDQDDLGFLLYAGEPESTLYSVPMSPEGGGWKVATVLPNALAV
ncbi:MAG: hypothetical protein ACRDLL_06895 [Solirubrobacterales bacterium]